MEIDIKDNLEMIILGAKAACLWEPARLKLVSGKKVNTNENIE